MATKYNAGAAILIEVEFKQAIPFSDDVFYDPDTYKISVWDKNETLKINQQDLFKSDTGKFYYVIQTEETWTKGFYKVKISASSGLFSDVKIINQNFILE